MSGWGWVRICSMLAAYCFSDVVVVAAVGRWIPYFWLLLVTFGYFGFFGYGYGNSNSKILLFGWGMNDHRYHVRGKELKIFKVREMTRLDWKIWSIGTMGTRRD